MLNRRSFLSALLAAPVGSRMLFAQTTPAPIKATKLSDHVAVLSGDGGNIALVSSTDGLLVIDTGLAARSADLLQAITEQSGPLKVRTVFNTHWHLDHVGANETLGKAGAKIIAHENVKKWCSKTVVMEALNNRTIEPLKPEGLPTETFSKGGHITFGKERFEYIPVPPAHTDGDAFLFFPGPNILHTGDLLFNGTYPLIDYTTGGWIGGMVLACDALLKIGDTKTRVIPGHGPIGTKEDLKASRDMLAAVHDRLQVMLKAGKTVQDAVAAAPTKDFDERFGKGTKPDQFVTIAFTGLQRHAG